MADVRAFRSGNWSDTNLVTSPWSNGTAIFAPAAGDVVYSNNFTIAIDQNITTGTITNASATSRTWKDGGTAAITSTTGGYTMAGTFAVNTNIIANNSATACLIISSGSSTVTGNVTGAASGCPQAILHSGTGTLFVSGIVTASTSPNPCEAIRNSGTGTISITGNVTGGTSNLNYGCNNASTGTISITGNVTGGGTSGIGVINSSTGTISITGNVTAGSAAVGANNASTGAFTVIGDITATNGVNGFTSSNSGAINRLSGSFINAANGSAAIYAAKYILNSTPLNAKTRYAKDGISQYVDMFTADNNLNQANPTDVRTGVSYASGALTGTLTVPAEGSVVLNAPVGPLMPFTATRSLTTATATLAYSYPYVAGDTIVVTGASNAEWNGTYTIASVISGTSITFNVPSTYSSTAGTGAQMQTVGKAILTASAIWDTLTSSLTTANSIGERLANTSTVATTGQQLQNILG